MITLGTVESLWRYPVKSMRGETMEEAFLEPGGFAGDRRFAIGSHGVAAPTPYLTSRMQARMLLFHPRYVDGNPMPGVATPQGAELPLDDPSLLAALRQGLPDKQELSLERAEVALADEFPVSLITLQTLAQLAREVSVPVDKRRFRANLYADFPGAEGFTEDSLLGRSLQIGDTAVIRIEKRDPRCKLITLDPDTAEADPTLLRHVAAAHERCAGVYGMVVRPGLVRQGDPIRRLP